MEQWNGYRRQYFDAVDNLSYVDAVEEYFIYDKSAIAIAINLLGETLSLIYIASKHKEQGD